MKIIIKNCEYANIIKEAIVDTIAEWGEGGLIIDAIPCDCEKKLKIESDGKNVTIHYSSLTALLRAVGNVIANGEKKYKRFHPFWTVQDSAGSIINNINTILRPHANFSDSA